jgi:tetratricopeptide (TPR) repeat protein
VSQAAISCAACGAKVREDRVRCLRCGQPLVAAETAQGHRSASLSKLLAASAAVGVVALTGVVLLRPDAPPAAVSGEAQASAPERTRRNASVVPRVVASLDARRPGEAAYHAGRIPEAVGHFREAVAADPGDPEALNNLGQVLVRSGQPREAIAYFDRAIAIVPDRWAFRFNRAKALGDLQEWTNAVAGYRDALHIFPTDYITQFNLAKALQRSGDLRGAIEGFERAIQLAPGQADFHLSHGLALEAASRLRDAAAAYHRYIELSDNATEVEQVKARIALIESSTASH